MWLIRVQANLHGKFFVTQPLPDSRLLFLTISDVCRRIPRAVLEAVYGINLVKPEEYEDPDRQPYAEELLEAYSCELKRYV